VNTPADTPERRRVVLQYTDEGDRRDDERPGFGRLVADLRERRAADPSGAPPAVLVSELSRLFRNRADRDIIDQLVENDAADVLTARERIDTAEERGRERYRRAADLLMLAYEGAPLDATTRRELVDEYARDILNGWLELVGTPENERGGPVADVRARLLGLAARWGTREARVLTAPYLELAEVHAPTELDIPIRLLALVGVRNSDLETLHLADHIKDYDWRVLTQAAAFALSDFAVLPAGDCATDHDPFAGIVEAHPTAAAAFEVLADMRPGDTREWQVPDRPPPELDAEIVVVPVTPEGYDQQHAMDRRVTRRQAAMLEAQAAGNTDTDGWAVPSLKHISRNPRKLFAMVDYLLGRGVTVATANVFIQPGLVRRREEPVPYNAIDLSWCGVTVSAHVKPGRNDPCWCGSGQKYKRCCGR
jgi:hypothetical protein